MKIKLNIQNYDDRNNMVVALANNGYGAVVTQSKNLLMSDYYVEFTYPVLEKVDED